MAKSNHFITLILLLGLLGLKAAGQSSAIKGKVTDTDGRPLHGAGITLEGTYAGVQAGIDGSFTLSGVKDGKYVLLCSFIGYETFKQDVELSGETSINIILIQKAMMTDEVIVSATRAGANSPIAFSDIGSEALQKRNAGQDLPYLLSLTPSVVETSESGNGIGYTSMRIRGSEGSRINVTIDGIPLNDAESQQVFWVDLPDLASSVENIQIQRGIGTSSNGAGAFGASVNIQTKSPENEPYTELVTSAGSFRTLKTTIAAGTGLLNDKFTFQTRFSNIRSDGYIDRTGSAHRSAYFSGVYRAGKSRIRANVILGEEKTGIGWWGVPGDSLSTNRTFNPAGQYTDETGAIKFYKNESDNYIQNHYQLIYSISLNDYLSLHSALHYTAGKGFYEEYKEDASLENYGLPLFETEGLSVSESDLIRRKWLTNDFYGIVYSVKYRKNKIDAAAGGGINLYSGDHFGEIVWMKYAGNVPKDHQWYFNNGEKAEMSVYGKLNYSLSDRATAFGDMQYRYIRYTMKGHDDDLKNLGQEHTFNFINPKAGLFWNISQNHDAYISFSVANREPTRADFKEAAGDPDATPKPETLYDTEIGYKFRSGMAATGLNFYVMYYSDQLVPTGELSNVGYPIMTNVGKSYRLGMEVSAGLKPADFIDWSFNLTLSRNKIIDFVEHYTDYNTTDWSEEYKSKSRGMVDIAYSPSITGSSDLNIMPLKNTELHFITKYVGSQYFDNTMSPERSIDPYIVNDLRLDYNPAVKKVKGIGFHLLVNNIFNNLYESNAYGGNWYENGEEKTWSYYFPQAGRNFMIKAEIKF